MKKWIVIITVGLISHGQMSAFAAGVWQITTVDAGGLTGMDSSLVVDSQGNVHIGYKKSDNQLYYANYDGVSWSTTSVDGMGTGVGLGIDQQGQPHIAYHWKGAGSADLRYASYSGVSWSTTNAVSGAPETGREPSLVIDLQNRAHVTFRDVTNGTATYALSNGGTWNVHAMETGSPNSDVVGLALDVQQGPHVVYANAAGDFRYSYYDGDSWETETVPSTGTLARYPDIVIDSDGGIHVSYYDRTGSSNMDVGYAYNDGTGWLVETIDTNVDINARGTSIDLDSEGLPHIAYYNKTTSNLYYASNDGDQWGIELVDDMGATGYNPSLFIDTNDIPHISYCDLSNYDLKYATILETSGDFDADGYVDGVDFGIWQVGYPTPSGASLGDGDADYDGDVDGVDFGIWQANYPPYLGGTAATPEPATLGLLLIGGLSLFRRRHVG